MSDDARRAPRPSVMPVDREAWRKELNLSNFVNAYYQFRDVTKWVGERPSVLVIGPGQGLDTELFKWRGCSVVTFDIDETFRPDVVGSCHEMPMFGDAQFDVVIASHVLEHLPIAYLDAALLEIARVGRHALVYLPVAGRHAMLRAVADVKGFDRSIVLDLWKFWERPDGASRPYASGQHYWEIGYRGFRLSDVRKRLLGSFEILCSYRNRDWLPSYNFVLRSKRARAAQAHEAPEDGISGND